MGINVLRSRLNLRNGSNKRLSWLKPNFSHHWLNYALSFIVFLGMFSATSALAALQYVTDGQFPRDTPDASCSAYMQSKGMNEVSKLPVRQ